MASTVYFYTMDCRTEHQNKESKVARLCNLLKLKDIVVPGRPCAIKLHFGETGCDGHLNPQLVQAAVQKVREAGALPFLTDTTTLYSGTRHNAVDHINTAIRHGFAPGVVDAPVIIADGLCGQSALALAVASGPWRAGRRGGGPARLPCERQPGEVRRLRHLR